MEYRVLGKSGLKVTSICLGAMDFGHPEWGTDEEESLSIIDAYVESGGNFIDTANVYSEGRSEEIVGKALKGRRDRLVLATKGFYPLVKNFGDPPAHPNALGASRGHLTAALEASLRRLGTDYVDLYQMHNWDPVTAPQETLCTLDRFIQQGKVRYVGMSNYTAWQIAETRHLSMLHGWEPFVTAQHQYSLISRDIEHGVVPVCQRYGIGILPWSPLGQGVLTGKYSGGKVPEGTRFGMEPKNEAHARWRANYLNDRNLAIAEEVVRVARDLGTTPVAVSIAWVLQRPGVASVIIGPRTRKQSEENLAAEGVSFTEDQLRRLDEVSTPPRPYPESMQAISPR
jgi:aryl-alcohol dehydrogenase-like predicted oxidoreductase